MKKVITSWWTVSIATVVLLALVVCVGLPLFVGWMQPWWVRALFAGGFLLVWLVWFLLRRRKIKKAEAALAAELTGPDPTDEEAAAVKTRMVEALGKLRESAGGGRGYLYSRPWYVIIGPPGAGKTTALLNSGLRFPFADSVLEGTGGTRNLDFLFCEEAVLVDTAGRYTTQDSDHKVDSAGWTRLLELLAKQRPFEPINGVLVAIPADDLQRGDVRVIDEHAAIIRKRLREIRESLETEVPVYLIITKSDHLAGMPEFFADLDVDGRRAVLGHTFDWKDRALTSSEVTGAFDDVLNALAARGPKRLEEEKDTRRRGLILGFPGQLLALRPALHRLIEGAFLKEDRPSGRLRGFYFTSGTQDGSAIDRVLEGVSDTYGAAGGAPQPGAAKSGSQGRAFFLNRLIEDVIFKEAGLPTFDAGVLRRRRIQVTSGLAAIAAFVLVAVVMWSVSFSGNRENQRQTARESAAIADLVAASRLDLSRVSEDDTGLAEALPVLDRLRTLPTGYADQDWSLWTSFGLFQSGLSRDNEDAYRIGLRRIMLPRLLLRLEETLRQERGDGLALYEPLKVYLMLGGAAPGANGALTDDQRAAVVRYIERDWAANVYPGTENEGLRGRLAEHLAALTGDPDMSAVWGQKRLAGLDGSLVAAARQDISVIGLPQIAYAILRQNASDPAKDWRIANVLAPGDELAFADSAALREVTVPFFFTPEGLKLFSTLRGEASAQLKDEVWVFAAADRQEAVKAEIGAVLPGISTYYTREYVEQWEGVIAALRAADYFNDRQAFRALMKNPSPLRNVLEAVRANTSFPKEEGKAGSGGLDAIKDRAESDLARGRNASLALRVVGAETAGGGGGGRAAMSIDQQIAAAFGDLHNWIGDAEGGGLKDFLETVRQTFTQVGVRRSDGIGDGAAPTLAQATSELDSSAAMAPALIQQFVEEVSTGGARTRQSLLKDTAVAAYTAEVLPACERATAGKFPFDGGSTEDAEVAAVREAFGPGGALPRFVAASLTPYLDTSEDYWRWDDTSEIAQGFSPVVPANLQKADILQRTMNEGLPLRIELTDLGREATRVELETGGALIRFDPETSPARQLQWQFGGGTLQSSSLSIYTQAVEGPYAREEVLWRHSDEGPWSLFRLMRRARTQNLSESSIAAIFNAGSGQAVFEISFDEDQNPFRGGGLWSVQCPPTL
jgi:type VI secretion system protein ImpL